MTSQTDPKRHPLYTEATGDGPVDITVDLIDHRMINAWSSDQYLTRLLTVIGGEFEYRDSKSLPEWRIRCSRADVRDFEHDQSYFADATVINPTVVATWDGITYLGVLTDARLYQSGTDPLTVTNRDTRSNHCDGSICGKPHPMAPFMPPERYEVDALFPHFAVITVRPHGRAQ